MINDEDLTVPAAQIAPTPAAAETDVPVPTPAAAAATVAPPEAPPRVLKLQ
jgi:hypothetical protein